MIPPLWLDYETFSRVDLKKCGSDVYARDQSTEILMAGFAIGDGPVYVWDNTLPYSELPEALKPYLVHGHGEIRAFNAPFEMDITQHNLQPGRTRIHLDQWKCAQVLAYSLSFAGGLDQILTAIFPDVRKDPRGKRLILKFCKPTPSNHNADRYDSTSHPEEWQEFIQYCAQDIVTLRRLWNWLEAYATENTPDIWGMWGIDRIINHRGIPVDMVLVKRALSAMTAEKELNKETLQTITGLDNISRNPLLAWFHSQGVMLPNLQRETKEAAFKTTQGTPKHALELSLDIAQASSSAKWNAYNDRTDKLTNLLRNSLQFNGAGRTGRYAGRGIQLQNQKRPIAATPVNVKMLLLGFPVTMHQISTSIRSAIKAPPGKKLVVSDLSSIESRLAGWLTNCKVINETFEKGLDTYKVLASKLYHVDYDQVSKAQRTFAKPAALGAQYMLGAKGLVRYADDYGVDLEEAEAKVHIDTYRALYPELPTFWDWIKNAIFTCVNKKVEVSGYKIRLYMDREFLFIELPSGRRLNYHKPSIEWWPAPWDRSEKIEMFTFMGMNSYTNKWERITAHAGGILENIIQAIALDVLNLWISRLHHAGAEIIGHVHDEVILLTDEDYAETSLKITNDMVLQPIPWAPGLKITAAGYIADRYKKD